jgi:hypothetical protein
MGRIRSSLLAGPTGTINWAESTGRRAWSIWIYRYCRTTRHGNRMYDCNVPCCCTAWEPWVRHVEPAGGGDGRAQAISSTHSSRRTRVAYISGVLVLLPILIGNEITGYMGSQHFHYCNPAPIRRWAWVVKPILSTEGEVPAWHLFIHWNCRSVFISRTTVHSLCCTPTHEVLYDVLAYDVRRTDVRRPGCNMPECLWRCIADANVRYVRFANSKQFWICEAVRYMRLLRNAIYVV